jgi:hypothetical protein
LFAGNSLTCARAQVYKPGSLRKGAKPAWHEEPPRQVTPAKPRQGDEIWHFLLPDPGMADYCQWRREIPLGQKFPTLFWFSHGQIPSAV